MPFLAVGVGDEAVHPLGQRDVRRVRASSSAADRRRAARPRPGRRPRPARRGWGNGGRASRSRPRRAWPRRPGTRPCPRTANCSVAAASSFSRLRRASARWLAGWRSWRNGGASGSCYLPFKRSNPPLDSRRHADVEGLVHHRQFQGLRPRLGRGGPRARRCHDHESSTIYRWIRAEALHSRERCPWAVGPRASLPCPASSSSSSI